MAFLKPEHVTNSEGRIMVYRVLPAIVVQIGLWILARASTIPELVITASGQRFSAAFLSNSKSSLGHFHVDLNSSLHPSCIEQSRLCGTVAKGTKSTVGLRQFARRLTRTRSAPSQWRNRRQKKRWRDSGAYRRPLSLQRVIASGNWGVDQSSLTYGFHLRGEMTGELVDKTIMAQPLSTL